MGACVMNTPDSSLASHGTGFAGTVFSLVAVAISMLPELDIWFRILASVSAIIAAWVSIYVMIVRLRKDK